MLKEKFKVTDAHCHIYPDKIAERAVHGTDGFYGGHSLCKGTVSDLISKGESAGVDHYVVQSVATSPKQVSHINKFIYNETQIHDNLTGLGTMHPESETKEEDIKEIIDYGLHGIKLHPDIQGFKSDCKGFKEIYELCRKYNLPILIHAGDYRYDFSNPNRISKIAEEFPDVTFVAAHLGGWSVWDDAVKVLPKYKNLYFDCSSCFPFVKDPEYVYKIIRTYGTERVLFGTDYPMWSVKSELDILMSLNFTDEEFKCILSENAEKVFGTK